MSHRSSARRTIGAVVAGAALIATALVGSSAPTSAAPGQNGCDNRTNNTYDKLLECVRLDGVREHQAALQAIADANGGTRADQTPGYLASVDYVVESLEGTRWQTDVVPFEYPGLDVFLEQSAPTAASYATGPFTGSGRGAVAGPITAVDLALDGDRASTSGCEAADFDGLDFGAPNDIALIQRGACSFGQKVFNAENAGAEAVIIFNQGNSPDREGVLTNVTLGAQYTAPTVAASFDTGVALAVDGAQGLASVEDVVRTSFNVIAELPGRTDGNVVMAGAHLDSVPAGPGINDNGSGSAALIEIAQQMSKSKPYNTVRFGWWGAEELGLIGSTEWVAQRTQEQLDEIALYLNFDMIGSPNYVFQVYDADESSFVAPVPVPEGSQAIEKLFESFYTLRGEPYDDSAFSGRSDYQAFINNGIPSSGLFTGAEVVKTAEQEAIWGGTAGEQFDPCYHLQCDTFDNNSDHALEVNSDAVAFVVFTYAASTETVNGVRGRKIPGKFTIPEPAGPQFTFAGPLGGNGVHEDHGDPLSE